MIWLVLQPLPPSPVTCVSFFVFLCVACRPGGGGAKSYDNEKAWSSINHLILFKKYSYICLTTFIAIYSMVLSSRNILSYVSRLHEVTSILLLLELDIVFYLSSLYSLCLSISIYLWALLSRCVRMDAILPRDILVWIFPALLTARSLRGTSYTCICMHASIVHNPSTFHQRHSSFLVLLSILR